MDAPGPVQLNHPARADRGHAAFYAAAHARLSAALGDQAHQRALDTLIDLYRSRAARP